MYVCLCMYVYVCIHVCLSVCVCMYVPIYLFIYYTSIPYDPVIFLYPGYCYAAAIKLFKTDAKVASYLHYPTYLRRFVTKIKPAVSGDKHTPPVIDNYRECFRILFHESKIINFYPNTLKIEHTKK